MENRYFLLAFLVLLCFNTLGQTTVYSDDFESSFEGWSSSDWSRDSDAALGISDGNYLHPSSFDNYGILVNVTTTSGTIDLSGQYDLLLQMDISYETDNTISIEDGFNIEYSSDGGSNWNLLGSDSEGLNWFNTNNVFALGDEGWSGNSGGWITASIMLPAVLENNSTVQFRVRFASDVNASFNAGIGFDNFRIISYGTTNSAPGNVSSGLSLWLKADGPLLLDGSAVNTWGDVSAGQNHSRQTTQVSQPAYLDSTINYNPTLQFDDSYLNGSAGFYTREFFVVIDPDFISSSSEETGDVIGFQPGDVGSLELGSATTQFTDEVITHTIDPATSYRSAYTDPSGEEVLANPVIINDRLNVDLDGQNIYLNGRRVDNVEEEAASHQNFDDGAFILGNGFDLADDFQGGIAEVISYSTRLSDSDKADVETYLAIKYGITLDEDLSSATTNFDYQVDGSTIIWPGTANAAYQIYHHDVAGIGKNEANQGLNQQTSQSINDATIVNVGEASDLDDGEYLVWGNDNDENSFTTSNIISGITHRLQRIWKVKETGDVGTVTLTFDITNLSVDKDNTTLNLIVAPGIATMPTDLGDDEVSTLILGGNVTREGGKDLLSFENIDFSDGDFFTIGGDVQTIAPGGVSAGLTLWLRPDDGVSITASNLVTSWADVSGSGNDADQGDDNEKPTLLENEINFNDAIDFSDDFLDGISGFNTHDYFLVLKPDATVQSGSGNGFVLGLRNGAFDGLYLGVTGADTLIGHAVNDYRSTYEDAAASVDGPVFILNSRNNAGATAQNLLIDDLEVDNGDGGTFANRSNSYFRLGNNFNSTDSYDGKIAEVISYDTRLSDADRRDVVSYLALKYGVTLDISSDPYTFSGTSIYNNTSYSNDIAGIGINLDHGLIQTSSVSGNADAIVTIAGGSQLGSEDYCLWGSDGTDKTLVQSTELPVQFEERMQTEWQVDVTGSPGPVSVKVYVGGITGYSNRAKLEGMYHLLVNTSNDFSTINTSYEGSYFSGDTIVFTNVSFTTDDYFTVAVPEVANVNGNLSLWLRADAGTSTTIDGAAVTTWEDQGGNNDATGSAGTRPLYVTDAIGTKPALDFDGTDDIMDGTAGFYSNDYFIVLDPDITYSYNSSGAGVIGFESGDFTGFGLGPVTSAAGVPDEVVTHLIGTSTSYRAAETGTGISYSESVIFNSSVNSTNDGQDILANGIQIDNAETNAGSFANLSNQAYRLGDVFSGIGFYNGKIAEILSFSARLSDNERRDITSYLAIKYGIELDISTTGYTYNDGTNLYNLTSYSDAICGIGANSSHALSVTNNTSLASSSILTVSSPSSLNNEDYLLWGHDGGVITSTTSNLPNTVTERVTRIWGVNETGDVGTVSLSFDLTGGGYGAYSLTDFSLIIDDDADFTNGTLKIETAASFDGTTLTFENVDLSGSVNFSIGTGRDLTTDTDSDGIPDYFELAYGTDPSDGDSPITNGGNDDNLHNTTPNNGINDTGINGDGVSDGLEQILIDNGASAPISRITDTDDDGIPDWIEVEDGTDPYDGDQPTDSGNIDTDNDGIPDAFEAYIASEGGAANPDLSTDSDSDGIPDYFEALNSTDPNDVNDPTASGGTDSDTDGISDALEIVLLSGGAMAPINPTSDIDQDGVPDYIESFTNTDPFNTNSPGLPSTVVNVRSLQADYESSGGNCIDVDGYQWIHVTDNNGNLVFSINPVGNDLGSTCWAVRILSGDVNVRKQTIEGVQDEYAMNRNWWIAPTTQPSSDVYVRFYSVDADPSDLRDAVLADGYAPSSLDEFQADSIHFTKISGINDLDPFVSGGTRTSHQPIVADAGTLGKSFTFGISSFSSFVPHYSPQNDDVPLPVELEYLIGEIINGAIVLSWRTLTEQNNDHFVVEHSLDGSDFNEIGKLNGTGDSSQPVNYQFAHKTPVNETNFYRLKQVDFDGEYEYSKTIVVDVDELSSSWSVYPNPSDELINLRIRDQSLLNDGFKLTLFDLAGKSYNVDSFVFADHVKIPIAHLLPGRYTLKIETPGNTHSFSIVVK